MKCGGPTRLVHGARVSGSDEDAKTRGASVDLYHSESRTAQKHSLVRPPPFATPLSSLSAPLITISGSRSQSVGEFSSS
jgi:hypothetical protein